MASGRAAPPSAGAGGGGCRTPSSGAAALTCGAVRGAVRSCCLCVAAACGAPAQRTAAPDVGLGWQQKGGFLAQNFSQAPPLPPTPPARHKGRPAARRRGGPGGQGGPPTPGRGRGERWAGGGPCSGRECGGVPARGAGPEEPGPSGARPRVSPAAGGVLRLPPGSATEEAVGVRLSAHPSIPGWLKGCKLNSRAGLPRGPPLSDPGEGGLRGTPGARQSEGNHPVSPPALWVPPSPSRPLAWMG